MAVLSMTSLCPLFDFDAHTGHYIVVSLAKTLNTNFQTGFSCGEEDSTGVCFATAYTGENN